MALSTGDAELMAQSQAAREAVYVRNELGFIGYAQTNASTLCPENSSANVWAEEDKYSGKAKHIMTGGRRKIRRR